VNPHPVTIGSQDPRLYNQSIQLLLQQTRNQGSSTRKKKSPSPAAFPVQASHYPANNLWCYFRSSSLHGGAAIRHTALALPMILFGIICTWSFTFANLLTRPTLRRLASHPKIVTSVSRIPFLNSVSLPQFIRDVLATSKSI
jgi:hypothetical protein